MISTPQNCILSRWDASFYVHVYFTIIKTKTKKPGLQFVAVALASEWVGLILVIRTLLASGCPSEIKNMRTHHFANSTIFHA